MIPTAGRIVLYRLSNEDVRKIAERRGVPVATNGAAAFDEVLSISSSKDGNGVAAGDAFPMVIVRAWGTSEGSVCNGTVLLDGTDTFWALSVAEGTAPHTWQVPPRV